MIYDYIDLEGNPVSRTPETHPYNYDSFLVWKGNYVKGQSKTVYSDRMRSWDTEKYNKAALTVFGKCIQDFSGIWPQDIQKFLSLYFDRKIELTAIVQSCNQSSGIPYWCFFYKEI